MHQTHDPLTPCIPPDPSGTEPLPPRREGRQISLWEYEYDDLLTKRIDTVFGRDAFAWIDAAWAAMLLRQKIIPSHQAPLVAREVIGFLRAQPAGYRHFGALERWVVEKHGAAVGGSLTIGRTVPPLEQMARVRKALLRMINAVYDVMETLLDVAGAHLGTVMPGYTHLRHAQPMTFGHYVLSVFDPLSRAMLQVEEGYRLMSLNELGCGALAGTSLPIDRDLTSAYLGLDGLIENTNDAVSYTDGYVTLVAALANVNVVFSRFTLDLNIWSSEDVAFLDVPWVRMENKAGAATQKEGNAHSHFMPNKTNNCPTLERSRVGAAEVLGALTEVTAMGMRCPHADMHEMLHMADATLRAIESTRLYIHPYIFVLPEMMVDRERMLAAAASGWSASTELGNRMVLDHGLDYRTAHHILNHFINVSKKAGRRACDARLEDLEAAAVTITGKPLGMSPETLRKSLDPTGFVKVTRSCGGVAVSETQRMLTERRTRMQDARDRQEGRVRHLEEAKALLIRDLERFCS